MNERGERPATELTPAQQANIDALREWAAETFGEAAEFTYINRKDNSMYTMTLEGALGFCAQHIGDSAPEMAKEYLGTLHRMNTLIATQPDMAERYEASRERAMQLLARRAVTQEHEG